MLINFCRGLLREHRVSSELWAAMVKEFGRPGHDPRSCADGR